MLPIVMWVVYLVAIASGKDKEENIRFYTERFGFKIIGEEKDGTVVVYQFQLKPVYLGENKR